MSNFVECHDHDGSGYYDNTTTSSKYYLVIAQASKSREEFVFDNKEDAEGAAIYLSGPHGGYKAAIYNLSEAQGYHVCEAWWEVL